MINDPEAVAWLDRESDKIVRARKLHRKVVNTGNGAIYDLLPDWLLERVRDTYTSHHCAPMYTLKNPDDGGQPWILRRFSNPEDQAWTPTLL